jgi:hypothetical protein
VYPLRCAVFVLRAAVDKVFGVKHGQTPVLVGAPCLAEFRIGNVIADLERKGAWLRLQREKISDGPYD